jgi:hypothetical protein
MMVSFDTNLLVFGPPREDTTEPISQLNDVGLGDTNHRLKLHRIVRDLIK